MSEISAAKNGDRKTTVYFVGDCDCVSNAVVYGLDESVRRAKFPKSTDLSKPNCELTNGIKALAQSKKGEGHDTWLKGVIVQLDLTFSNKAWVEAERYHFLEFVSSQSTMHCITKFNIDKSYNEYVDPRIIQIIKEKVEDYNYYTNVFIPSLVAVSEEQLHEYEQIRDKLYLEILYSNPSGFRLTAGMTTNYLQLKTIYSQRKFHRLPEWREFCKWIESLPQSELITGNASDKDGR